MRLIIVASLAIAGCTSVADLRDDQPFAVMTSDKAPAEWAACMTQQWEAGPHSVNVVPLPNGMSARQSSAFIDSVQMLKVVDAVSVGTETQVTVYKRGGESSEKMQREIEACA